jgi:pimeloyl-ACP methyl ester carboxylesterase
MAHDVPRLGDASSTALGRRRLIQGTGLVAAGTLGLSQLSTTAHAAPLARRGRPGFRLPKQAPATYAHAPVPGGHLEYWDTGGRGPTVVLCHPATGSHESWPFQQPVLARAGYRVIGYSRRGHLGSSANSPETQPVASDDLRLLLDHLDLERVHLLSAAYGGYFATDFALSYPERVRELIVVSSFMGIIDPDYLALTNSLRPEPFNSMPSSFKELSPSYRATNPDGVAAWNEIVARAVLPGSSFLQRMANQITWDRLSDLRPRTLLVTGSSDLYMPPPVMGTIASHIDRARSVIYPEVGHSANWEVPRDFNTLLLSFLAGRSRR